MRSLPICLAIALASVATLHAQDSLAVGYPDSLATREPEGASRADAGRFFAEAQRAAEKHTDLSLANLLGDAEMPPNLTASPVDLVGLSARLGARVGVDPDDWIVFGSVHAEDAVGDRRYLRASIGGGASHPLAPKLTVAAEA